MLLGLQSEENALDHEAQSDEDDPLDLDAYTDLDPSSPTQPRGVCSEESDLVRNNHTQDAEEIAIKGSNLQRFRDTELPLVKTATTTSTLTNRTVFDLANAPRISIIRGTVPRSRQMVSLAVQRCQRSAKKEQRQRFKDDGIRLRAA